MQVFGLTILTRRGLRRHERTHLRTCITWWYEHQGFEPPKHFPEVEIQAAVACYVSHGGKEPSDFRDALYRHVGEGRAIAIDVFDPDAAPDAQ